MNSRIRHHVRGFLHWQLPTRKKHPPFTQARLLTGPHNHQKPPAFDIRMRPMCQHHVSSGLQKHVVTPEPAQITRSNEKPGQHLKKLLQASTAWSQEQRASQPLSLRTDVYVTGTPEACMHTGQCVYSSFKGSFQEEYMAQPCPHCRYRTGTCAKATWCQNRHMRQSHGVTTGTHVPFKLCQNMVSEQAHVHMPHMASEPAHVHTPHGVQ
jgi:hypothetical protein